MSPPPTTAPSAAPGGALLRRLGERDPAAWAEVVTRYRGMVLAVARGHGLGPDEAEDVEQRVWLLLLEHHAAIRDPRALPGWLRTTARHESGDVRRRGRRESPLGDVVLDRPAAGPEVVEVVVEHVVAGERRHALRAAIERLRPQERDLVRTLLADLSYREISTELGIPVGSIGPVRGRVLTRLRHQIAADT